jgi:hypothetical protein
MIVTLAFVPVLVVFAFSVHWGSVASLHSSAERLPACRITYFGFSFLMNSFAWLLFVMYGTRAPLAFLLPLGATFACAGDFYNLQFETARHSLRCESVFGGILFFILTQVSYAAAFLARVPLQDLVRRGFFVPVLISIVALCAAFYILRVWSPSRPRKVMLAAGAYALTLAFMTSVAVSAAIAARGSWLFVALGAASFVVSDGMMGETTIHGRHPASEFQVPWLAYLIAQALIPYGYALTLL